MANLLTKGMSKFITAKPSYPGDLGHNLAFYAYRPDYKRYDDRNIAMQAEALASVTSLSRDNSKIAMIVASMSSGIVAYDLLEHYNKTDDVSKKITVAQDLTRKVPRDILVPEVFEQNKRKHNRTAEIAASRFKDYYIDIPSDSEELQRSINSNKAASTKAWEDWAFEMHYWLPKILQDTDAMIYHGDKSFSRNGSLEQAAALAIQYGLWVPLEARGGRSIDVKDIKGRDISPVDQAWEDAKHIVYVVEKGFQTDTAAALLMVRFMYEEWRMSNNENLVAESMHPSVKNQSYNDMEKMAELQKIMLPYLAHKCDWSVMHEAFENDPALKNYWDEIVAPNKKVAIDCDAVYKSLFSYIPRGGYHYPEVDGIEVVCRDANSLSDKFMKPSNSKRQLGSFGNPFDMKLGKNILYPNSGFVYDFHRLGVNGDIAQAPDNDKMTRSQIASFLIASAMESDRMPLGMSNKYLYLDNPASGVRAAKYIVKHNLDDWREAYQERIGGDSFRHNVVSQTEEDYKQRYYELLNMKDWRAENEIGNLISLTTLKEMPKLFEGNRDSIGAKREEAIAAEGPIKMGDVANVVARAADFQGIIIPKGALLDDTQYSHILHSVMVATGQIEKSYEGGRYNMRFFYDEENNNPPREIDFGDILLLAGNTVKHFLNKESVPDYRAIVYTAQLFDIYERMIDPARRNNDEKAIDWKQVNAVNPNFANFTEDRVKAKEVHKVWNELVGVNYDEKGRVVSQGLILERAMSVFDKNLDLPYMPQKYESAMNKFENKLAKAKENYSNTNSTVIKNSRGGFSV